jgi:hypothetical protein
VSVLNSGTKRSSGMFTGTLQRPFRAGHSQTISTGNEKQRRQHYMPNLLSSCRNVVSSLYASLLCEIKKEENEEHPPNKKN